MAENDVITERMRIKALIVRKIEGVDILCIRKRDKATLSKTIVVGMLNNLIFHLDNPDYVKHPFGGHKHDK